MDNCLNCKWNAKLTNVCLIFFQNIITPYKCGSWTEDDTEKLKGILK